MKTAPEEAVVHHYLRSLYAFIILGMLGIGQPRPNSKKKVTIRFPVTTIPPHKRLMNIWFWSNNNQRPQITNFKSHKHERKCQQHDLPAACRLVCYRGYRGRCIKNARRSRLEGKKQNPSCSPRYLQIDFLQGGPETHGIITDRQFRHRHSTRLELAGHRVSRPSGL